MGTDRTSRRLKGNHKSSHLILCSIGLVTKYKSQNKNEVRGRDKSGVSP